MQEFIKPLMQANDHYVQIVIASLFNKGSFHLYEICNNLKHTANIEHSWKLYRDIIEKEGENNNITNDETTTTKAHPFVIHNEDKYPDDSVQPNIEFPSLR